jgi:nickel-dependent lactate racemase
VTEFSLPYGKTHLTVNVPKIFEIDVLVPQSINPLPDGDDATTKAIASPLGKLSLSDFADAGTIGIAINDKTRPMPKPNPLNHLLSHLSSLGFSKEQITIFIGSGTHTPMSKDEFSHILDEAIVEDYQVIVHDCDQSPMADLGKTAYKTPIQINQAFYECDIKITVGNIEPHHFMGFSGGVKTAAIGLASRETINTNHAMLIRDQTRSGVFHINPMRQDIEEIGRKAEIHFTLGTVLNEQKQILQVFFGDPQSVMQAAIPITRQVFGVTISHLYDLVIASPGGAPKDINLYQAQKGLTHAARITKDGGWVVLLAACPEGSGSQSYEDYVTKAGSHEAVIKEFKNGFFKVGPHKAFQIAREALRVNLVLVSDIPPQDVKQWKLTPSQPKFIDQLMDWLTKQLPPKASIAIMPATTLTMAEVKDDAK